MLGATLLAQRDAWRELRGGGKPVATIHNLSPIFDRETVGDLTAKLEEMYWDVWMRADRDGVLELPGRAEREVPDLREACDLVGFSYYSATGIDADGQGRAVPVRRRASGRWATRRGAKDSGSCCAACTRSCPAGRC